MKIKLGELRQIVKAIIKEEQNKKLLNEFFFKDFPYEGGKFTGNIEKGKPDGIGVFVNKNGVEIKWGFYFGMPLNNISWDELNEIKTKEEYEKIYSEKVGSNGFKRSTDSIFNPSGDLLSYDKILRTFEDNLIKSENSDETYYKLTANEAKYFFTTGEVKLSVKNYFFSDYVIKSAFEFKEARERNLTIVADPGEMMAYYLKKLRRVKKDKETIDKLIDIAENNWELALTLYKHQEIR
jgi:hypothetical protein